MRIAPPVIVLLLALLVPSPARAQSSPRADTVFSVSLGSGETWDDEGSVGTGVLAGGHLGRRLLRNTFLDLSLDVLRHNRNDAFNTHGTTMLASAALVRRFGHRAAQPYVLGLLTLAHHSGDTLFVFDDVRTSQKSTDPGWGFGGGLTVRVGERYEVGPEARFYVINASRDPDPAWANWIGVRAGVRF